MLCSICKDKETTKATSTMYGNEGPARTNLVVNVVKAVLVVFFLSLMLTPLRVSFEVSDEPPLG